jgi:cell division protease FtsH
MSQHSRDPNASGPGGPNLFRAVITWVAIGLVLAAVFNMYQEPAVQVPANAVAYTDFLKEVKNSKIIEVTQKGSVLSGRTTDGKSFSTLMPTDPNLVDRLTESGVRLNVQPEDKPSFLANLLLSILPMILLIGVWVYFMRQMGGGAGGKGGAMGFGRSRAKMLGEKDIKVTFDDVAGIDEARQELVEVVEFLKDPPKFQRLGGKIPKGVLLVGPPGTGKTLLAKAIAGEAAVPFFSISGSDFVEMFVGVGASRVRDMFEQGKKNAPCIIFIDEIDAVGRHRGAGMGGGNDEREQTLNQMLVEMDGFEANEGVILIAATNRPDVLDPALLRPGRFDRQVTVANPDVAGREKILKVHMRKTPLEDSVDPRIIARGTPGFSGADLANLVNEAALLAARKNKKAVGMVDLEEAKDKVMMGAERRSMVMSDNEKKLTAYHEAGHAVIALQEPESDPIHKATIIPRGRALGMVMRLPEGDRLSVSVAKLKADLAVAMGGRVAEEMIFGAEKVTTGASSDIAMVTNIATRMVTEWGMSEKLGLLAYAAPEREVFLGHSVTQSKNISDATARMVDEEVRKISDEALARARQLLTDHRDQLESIAQALLEYETLTGDEMRGLIAGKPIERAVEESARPKVVASARKGSLGGFVEKDV